MVSLIYACFQIDQNTNELRAGSVQSIVENDLALTLALATDPVLLSAISKIIAEEEELSFLEAQAMRQVLLAQMRVLKEIYGKYQLGYLSDEFVRSRIITIANFLERFFHMNEMFQSQKRFGVYPLEFLAWFELQQKELFPEN